MRSLPLSINYYGFLSSAILLHWKLFFLVLIWWDEGSSIDWREEARNRLQIAGQALLSLTFFIKFSSLSLFRYISKHRKDCSWSFPCSKLIVRNLPSSSFVDVGLPCWIIYMMRLSLALKTKKNEAAERKCWMKFHSQSRSVLFFFLVFWLSIVISIDTETSLLREQQ